MPQVEICYPDNRRQGVTVCSEVCPEIRHNIQQHYAHTVHFYNRNATANRKGGAHQPVSKATYESTMQSLLNTASCRRYPSSNSHSKTWNTPGLRSFVYKSAFVCICQSKENNKYYIAQSLIYCSAITFSLKNLQQVPLGNLKTQNLKAVSFRFSECKIP